MGDPAPTTNRALALGKTVAQFVAVWTLAVVSHDSPFWRARLWVSDAINRVFAGFPSLQYHAHNVFSSSEDVFARTFLLMLFLATILAPLGAAARMVARARARAGHADFLDRIRAWTRAHPTATSALLAAPGIAWLLHFEWPSGHDLDQPLRWARDVGYDLPTDLLAVWVSSALAARGLRALLAPTMGGAPAARRFDIGPDEIRFDAVAVTRRTKMMVAAFTTIVLGIPLFIVTRPLGHLYQQRWLFDLVLFNVVFATTGALAFRRASHVAVGVDGVHVRGTAKARFYAYRDIDAARVNGGDIELVRRDRAVLRLQLHGEDAARREAILARIADNIARVKQGHGAVAAQVVANSSKDELARVAHGAADYRMAALTRDQLWALVEGPEVEASARRAAAEALVSSAASGDGRERARLRVAADHCAEPNVRVALAELAGTDEGEGASKASRSARAARVV